ncbi:DUF6134 family protein [Falsiroseomonas sp. HW251]|uniref:DUF6134 family protein n=1 Tax=Falsiroseomonas sp. HW251 TaxID=3390998 RepID=UPI003D31FFBD
MIGRRLVLGTALLPFAGRGAMAAPADINFRIMRGGSQVGTHGVRFRDEGDLLRARTEMRIRVTLAGFTVFRFTQDTEEAWRGERLVALESRADRNGTPGFCSAVGELNGLRLRGTAGEALLPPNAAPLTWWRAATLLSANVPLFDVREGRAVQPRLERMPQAGGQRIRVIGGEGAEVAYDARGNWTFFATTGEDGSSVTYERS